MRSISAKQWILAGCSAVLQLLPFAIAGPVDPWRRVLSWICLVPLIVAMLSEDSHGRPLKPLQTTLLGYLSGVLWYAGNCYWIYQTMHIYGGIPELPSFGILVLFSLYLGLYHALFGWVIGKLRSRTSVGVTLMVAPFAWVAVELARARITGFPWDLLGYTQVNNLALTVLAPIGGVMLLSFVVVCINALFAAAILAEQRRRTLQIIVLATTFTAILQGGMLYHPADDPASHQAVLLQENLAVGAEFRELHPTTMEQRYDQFEELSKVSLHSANAAELIVWPEAPADFITSDAEFQSQLSRFALTSQTPVITGALGVDFDRSAERGYREYGSAAVFNRDGSYAGRYDKIHRVPWGEYVPFKQLFFFAGKLFAGKLIANAGNMLPGTAHTIFDLNRHRVGIFICYESIFGDEVRQFTRRGAQLLVNISDDGWYGDSGAPWQHLDMARMRAIENRRWILRDTNTGITTSIDPHGRGNFSMPRHVREAFVFAFDYRNDMTIYARFGDWFAWLCVLVTGGLLVVKHSRPQPRTIDWKHAV